MKAYLLTIETTFGNIIDWGIYLDKALAEEHGEKLILRNSSYADFSIKRLDFITQ